MATASFVLALGALRPAPAGAVKPEPSHVEDSIRFGLDRAPEPAGFFSSRSPRAREAIRAFNAAQRGGLRASFGPQGLGDPAAGAARREADELARRFLEENRQALALDPAQLRLEFARTRGELHHLRFEQVVDGIPVERAAVKVHLTRRGEILSLQSSFRPGLLPPGPPRVPEALAAQAIASELGGLPPAGGTLVLLPLPDAEAVRLAWKFRASGAGGSWLYFVDAADGRVLLRYNDLRFQASCQSSGTITGEVFDIDPTSTPMRVRGMRHQYVYVIDETNRSTTDASGFFCSQTAGRIFTQLQGPFAAVAHFNFPSVHYDNGKGSWQTFSSPVDSPHPYSADAVLISTINAPVGAVKVLPRFASFDVGAFDTANGDITDNDQVAVLDAAGNAVGTYVGTKSAFFGAAVPGRQLRVRLKTNATGAHNGFSINISSYLTLDNAVKFTPDNATASFTWITARTFDGTRDEFNLFYHVNLMRDYFRNGVDADNSAPIDQVLPVMARVGPNLANAFYDPLHQYLAFGDVGNGFALDASVIHHEYVHFVVDQIFPIVNFGQNGALSEALADYFSATSLNQSTIGRFTNNALGGSGALRNLDCLSAGSPPCKFFPTNWLGLIHDDGLMVSQPLWEIRENLRQVLGASNGQACGDGLVFESLFFFPDSFQELLDAMLTVNSLAGTNPATCGVVNQQSGLIAARFAAHGISENPTDEDRYEPNDGIQTATDITTASAISGRIFPQADLDYFALGAGPGPIRITLGLPEKPGTPGVYIALGLTLLDKDRRIVTSATPSPLLNPTLSGFCPEVDCITSSPRTELEHDNPSPNQFYLVVSAPGGDESFVSRNFSSRFYSLSAEYNRTGPVAAGIVTAQFDRDLISFSVGVSTFVRAQNYSFTRAQLRDHNLTVLSPTRSDAAGSFLSFVSSANAFGVVRGSVRLGSGFSTRFPAVGTVYLEVFGVNPLGHEQSLGTSQPLHITSNRSAITAFNNVFHPNRGQATTIKYELQSAGQVTLRLYTRTGRHVATLLDHFQPAGQGSVDWTGRNFAGQTVASGVYLLHMEGPGISETKKIIVVK